MEKRSVRREIDEEVVLMYVRGIRARQPRLGTRKMHAMLAEVLRATGIRMGRDGFFALLREHGLLVRRKRRHARTTDSNHGHRTYQNLIRGYEPSEPEQVWSSDITYVATEQGFAYVSLVTDQYSRKIMGYHIHDTLTADGPLRALTMAMKHRTRHDTALIHHSDRGIQYCSVPYRHLLERNGILGSMSAPGNPYENAVAERVNGILKTEYCLDGSFRTIDQVRRAVVEAVQLYNTCRPHASCDYLTPDQAHQCRGPLRKRWRHYPPKTQRPAIGDEARQAQQQMLAK